jgi:hypothetical protein
MQEYPELYARFKAGSEPVLEGTPLAEWPMMSGSAMRELQYLGFKTVEQLGAATDDVKRKLGPLSKFVKLAKDWLEAANSTQNDVAKMKNQLEKAEARAAALEHKLELFMQRVEANEGIDLRPQRKAFAEEAMEEGFDGDEELDEPAKRRGRPKKA